MPRSRKKPRSPNVKAPTSSVLDAKPDQHDKMLARVEALQAPGTVRSLDVYTCPTIMRTKLKYTQRTSFSSTLGVLNARFMSANGLFDVDITGVGGQPEGFDQWSAFYSSYRVVSSRLIVKAGSTGTTAPTGSFWIIIVPQTSSTALPTMADAQSTPFAVSRLYEIGAQAVTLSQTMSIATAAGLAPQAVMADFSLVGNPTANPADTHFWGIYIESADLASTVTTHLVIEVDFVVDFFDRIIMSLSADSRLAASVLKSVREKFATEGQAKIAVTSSRRSLSAVDSSSESDSVSRNKR